MKKIVNILDVFLSAPSDVDEECSIVLKISNEINEIWSRYLGVQLKIIHFKNLRPTIDDDLQKGVNRQVGDNYDMYLGILWNRIGTETPRAISGTVEEFKRAFYRFDKDASVEIMVYFKRQTKNDEQAGMVEDFKREVGDLGVRYQKFEDIETFESMMRSHLSVYMQEKAEKIQHMPLKQGIIEEVRNIQQGYVDSYENNLRGLIDIYYQINNCTVELTSKQNKLLERINTNTFNNKVKLVFEREVGFIARKIKTLASKARERRVKTYEAISKALMWLVVKSEKSKLALENLYEALRAHEESFEKMLADCHEYNSKPPMKIDKKVSLNLVSAYREVENELRKLVYSNEDILVLIERKINLEEN
ncbi:hypothetical protein [Marinicella sp. W31]|uniref:hypothetical protein n=1 Tax=Marinicella sp. W31 TaxID=3023713 RepID=UPI0037565BD9